MNNTIQKQIMLQPSCKFDEPAQNPKPIDLLSGTYHVLEHEEKGQSNPHTIPSQIMAWHSHPANLTYQQEIPTKLLCSAIHHPPRAPCWRLRPSLLIIRYANDHDVAHLLSKTIPMNLIWSKSAQWLLSYSVCKVQDRWTDGWMDRQT